MALDPSKAAVLSKHSDDVAAIYAAVLGLCWPSDSPFASALNIDVLDGESLEEAADRLDLAWSPAWLVDAGYHAIDAAGVEIRHKASASGTITWSPEIRMCRVDDQVADGVSAAGAPYRRRLAGEVALHALWAQAARLAHIDFNIRPSALSGNTRGALFRDILVYFLQERLPTGWRVHHEVPLKSIRGMHMRKNVGSRRSDIVVVDGGQRLVTVISSKWTWRSDRGTEAAQMVLLSRYRPDVPYALATAEFPRVPNVAQESIEDRVYHICPEWAGAWYSVNRTKTPRKNWPQLEDLAAEGEAVAAALDLASLHALADDLIASGTVL
ncbi:hypothetical protein [Actinomadura madurae]|uniref:hypothetical protein n=1 Tax=Actinomadura madurae TaxID=1993 RepID=UPI000D8FB63D|nr:hypothetical protein [Actinomadura madurae]SPT60523.1 Uncharacterised protein [Actinomadura madurae]